MMESWIHLLVPCLPCMRCVKDQVSKEGTLPGNLCFNVSGKKMFGIVWMFRGKHTHKTRHNVNNDIYFIIFPFKEISWRKADLQNLIISNANQAGCTLLQSATSIRSQQKNSWAQKLSTLGVHNILQVLKNTTRIYKNHQESTRYCKYKRVNATSGCFTWSLFGTTTTGSQFPARPHKE